MSAINLQLNRVYLNWAGQHIKIVNSIADNDSRYSDGFRFIGSNNQAYRKDGTSGDCDLYEDVTDKVSLVFGEPGRVCETQEEANKLQFENVDTPHGSIQWKGTGVCMSEQARAEIVLENLHLTDSDYDEVKTIVGETLLDGFFIVNAECHFGLAKYTEVTFSGMLRDTPDYSVLHRRAKVKAYVNMTAYKRFVEDLRTLMSSV